jgi:inner membrane transporter RhtA
MPVAVILIAMLSIQSGASLAKSLFPLVGAPGVTALRIALGTAILVVIFKPWRLRFKKNNACPCCFTGCRWGP